MTGAEDFVMKKDFENEKDDFDTAPTFMLFDEQLGTEAEYVLLARTVLDGQLYYALSAVHDPEAYVILAVSEDGEDIVFETVQDDATFNAVAEAFDELFENEMDYDVD